MAIETRTAAPSLPIETVTPIKPSEAIRLGCLTTGQLINETYVDIDGARACVFGAMAIGYGEPHRAAQMHAAINGHLIDSDVFRRCPESGCASVAFPMHLNDDHRWSRERIADWLEGLGL
jgi:hypothetical protein